MGRKRDTFDIQNIYQTAVTLHQQGETTRAINLYCQVLDHFPEVAEVYYNLGLAWFEMEQFAEAIEAYKRAAEINSHDSDILYNLGLAYKMDRQYEKAEEAYLKALDRSADDNRDILYNLGCCYQDAGVIEHACMVYERLLQLVPDHLSALNNLAYLQHLQKNYAQARELYGRVLELDPDRRSAQHMFASLTGQGAPAPPPEYICELFDRYSENFEENLVKDLEYNTYCILRQAVDSLNKTKTRYEHGLDLGCGTGLAGEAFHSTCARLTGVDLSAKMLAQADKKNLYRELHCVDILEFLRETNQRFDLIIAADVLPYLGNLEPLFTAAAERASVNAIFCLSSEGTNEQEWELQITGRYAHNPDYILQTAEQRGWTVLEKFSANIRKESNAWIRGSIFVFGRKS